MSQRLIQPGLSAAGKYHPRTALPIEPIGEVNGKPIWPVIGGDENDDEDDPRFQDGGGEDDDDEDDEDEDDDDDSEDDDSEDDDEDDEDDKKKKKSKDKKKKSKDDGDKPKYTEEDMYAVKRRMRKADQRASRLEEELRELKRAQTRKPKPKAKAGNDDADSGGVDNEELERIKKRNERLEADLQNVKLEKAFSRVPLPEGEEWVDIEDAIAAAQRLGLLEDVLEEDGTVDRRSLRAALRELKRQKPHLVRKVSDPDEDEDEDDEEGQRPKKRRTASKMNGKRKGKGSTTDKAELAKRFPVLGR